MCLMITALLEVVWKRLARDTPHRHNAVHCCPVSVVDHPVAIIFLCLALRPATGDDADSIDIDFPPTLPRERLHVRHMRGEFVQPTLRRHREQRIAVAYRECLSSRGCT